MIPDAPVNLPAETTAPTLVSEGSVVQDDVPLCRMRVPFQLCPSSFSLDEAIIASHLVVTSDVGIGSEALWLPRAISSWCYFAAPQPITSLTCSPRGKPDVKKRQCFRLFVPHRCPFYSSSEFVAAGFSSRGLHEPHMHRTSPFEATSVL